MDAFFLKKCKITVSLGWLKLLGKSFFSPKVWAKFAIFFRKTAPKMVFFAMEFLCKKIPIVSKKCSCNAINRKFSKMTVRKTGGSPKSIPGVFDLGVPLGLNSIKKML